VLDLPHVVIPAVLYNALICALATAASWHLMSIALDFVRRVRRRTTNR
jgi:hypothetical protein